MQNRIKHETFYPGTCLTKNFTERNKHPFHVLFEDRFCVSCIERIIFKIGGWTMGYLKEKLFATLRSRGKNERSSFVGNNLLHFSCAHLSEVPIEWILNPRNEKNHHQYVSIWFFNSDFLMRTLLFSHANPSIGRKHISMTNFFVKKKGFNQVKMSGNCRWR